MPDAAEREQALDVTRSFIVEAPAGSGKTGLLIQRLLKLLASPSVSDPSQVLSITFTRKASHEMRDRVLAQLQAARLGDPPAPGFDKATRRHAEAVLARDAQLGWDLLEHPDRLNISTIDAFCIKLTGSLPVLSGSGGQAPVDDASELYTAAARRTLSLLGGPDPTLHSALETLLLHRDGNLADCESLIAEMLAWRDQWGNLIPVAGRQLDEHHLENVTLPRLNRALDLAICRALTRLTTILPSSTLDELCLLASELALAEGYNGAASPIAICRGLTQAPRSQAADLEHWRALAHLLVKPSKPVGWRKSLNANHLGFHIPTHLRDQLKDITERLEHRADILDALCALSNLPPVEYPAQQWHVAKALFRVLSRALVELQLVFAERGQCDFTEFSLLARAALAQPAALDDLTRSTGFNLEHLLVDEMQDTSTSQYELIRLLTQHWDGASQTVFLVGDPKQSIYLFRQARVERFVDTLNRQRLGDVPLTPLHLSANFRSQANLVASFNSTFSVLFPSLPDASDSAPVPYREALPTRSASGPHIEWHASATPYSEDRSTCERYRQLQNNASALKIRQIIEDWRARPLPVGRTKPWSIAVLVRNRKHLLPVVKALKGDELAPAIPYKAIKVEPLSERQEVLDLLALTRAVLHPADRTAWLALLRTPWCGLTLRDLHLLAGADDPVSNHHTILNLISERGDLLSDDGVARLQSFWTCISAALAERDRIPLARLVERTWRAFGADRFVSQEEAANVQRFLALLDEQAGRPGTVSIGSLAQAAAKLYAAESATAEAVDLMTIHNAKGLEWDFVIVPQLDGSAGTNRGRLLTWLEVEDDNIGDLEVARGIIAPVQPRGEQAYALNKWMRSIESSREAAERRRLFYVACTRAREELHLFASPGRKKDGGISLRTDSLLKAAWPAAQLHFQNLPTPQVDDAEEPGYIPAIAASGISLVSPPPPPPPRTIQRIPVEAFPLETLSPHPAPAHKPSPPAFTRPQGSTEARVFGNAMHALLEQLASRLAAGATVPALLKEVATWAPRVSTLLRAGGLAPDALPRASTNLLRGLTQTLNSPDGQWVLAPHPQAASESAFNSASGTTPGIRLDRTFLAGATPQTDASTHLWIVDFKTSTHGTQDHSALATFLAEEREHYAPQLETYAAAFTRRGLPIRLALFYPMLPRLISWPYEGDGPPPS